MISLGGFARLANAVDLDAGGRICPTTFEHASQRTDVKYLVVEAIASRRCRA